MQLTYDINPIDYLPDNTWILCDPKDRDAWKKQIRKVFEAQRTINFKDNRPESTNPEKNNAINANKSNLNN